jgi:hypothetical protein
MAAEYCFEEDYEELGRGKSGKEADKEKVRKARQNVGTLYIRCEGKRGIIRLRFSVSANFDFSSHCPKPAWGIDSPQPLRNDKNLS